MAHKRVRHRETQNEVCHISYIVRLRYSSAMINPFLVELKRSYEQRRQKNGRYSLRAFSRDLKVEPSVLSKLLRGTRQFTDESIGKLGKAMGLGEEKIRHFKVLNDDYMRSYKLSRNRLGISFKELPIEEYELIARSHYINILEAVKIPQLAKDPERLAQALKIPPVEAKEFLDRLVKHGYLQKNKSGHYVNAGMNVTSLGNKFTTLALKELQKEFLRQSIQAVDTVEFEKRSHSFLVAKLDSKKVGKAIEKIHGFRRDMNRGLNRGSRKADAVYCLQLSFFPVCEVGKES